MRNRNLLEDLNSVNEVIKGNPVCSKLFAPVDYLLYKAGGEVVRNTVLYDDLVHSLLQLPNKQKRSCLKRDVFDIKGAEFLDASPAKQVELLPKLKIHRDLVAAPILQYIKHGNQYLENLTNPESMWNNAAIREYVRARGRHRDLTLSLIKAKGYHDHYRQVRDAIVSKYFRLIVKYAYQRSHEVISLPTEDIASNNYEFVLEAFNQFDPGRGTFASQVTQYLALYKRKDILNKDEGIAFTITPYEREKMANKLSSRTNFLHLSGEGGDAPSRILSNTHSVDTQSVEDSIIQDQSTNFYANLLNEVDPKGWYRFFNDVSFDYQKHWGIWK